MQAQERPEASPLRVGLLHPVVLQQGQKELLRQVLCFRSRTASGSEEAENRLAVEASEAVEGRPVFGVRTILNGSDQGPARAWEDTGGARGRLIGVHGHITRMTRKPLSRIPRSSTSRNPAADSAAGILRS